MKRCSKCKLTKATEEFGRRPSRGPTALKSWCKLCESERQREWRSTGEGRRFIKEYNAAQRGLPCPGYREFKGQCGQPIHYTYCRRCTQSADLWHRYCLTLPMFEVLLEEQGGRCKICGTDEPGGGRWPTWYVDHDHSCCPHRTKTCGKCVRGILCGWCNSGLGYFKDDIVRLAAAISYLQGCPRK